MYNIDYTMLKTQGYMMKKVWQNGRLKEDIEVAEKGDDEGIRLVIRDKEDVEDVEIPREVLLRAMFSEKPSSQSLKERLDKLIDTTYILRKRSNKSKKHRKKTKSGKKVKSGKKTRKTSSSKKVKKTKSGSKTKKKRGTVRMVCRPE